MWWLGSLGFLFEFDVAELDGEAVAAAESLGELFGEEDGTMLAAGATKRDHEVFEAARLVVCDAGVDERIDRCQELMHSFLLIEIFDDGRVATGELLENFFAAGIGKAAAIEDESAAVAAFVPGQFAMEGKAVDANDEVVRFLGDA